MSTTSSKSIYIVQGSSGEYEDTEYWTVAAFTNKKKAEKFAETCSNKANKAFEEVEAKREEWRRTLEVDYPESEGFPEDPEAVIGHNTSYAVSKIRLNPPVSR